MLFFCLTLNKIPLQLTRKSILDLTLELTIAEKLWLLIVQILTQIAEFLEIDLDLFMEKLLTDNQILAKLQNFNSLLLLNYRACES